MADLTADCCTPAAQESCCEPSGKASCCGDPHATGCGCSADSSHTATIANTTSLEQMRETVRVKYASAATAAGASMACCGAAEASGAFGASLYAGTGESGAPEAAIRASLGCGVPTAVAERLIVEGFFREVLHRFPVEGVEPWVSSVIAARLDESGAS